MISFLAGKPNPSTFPFESITMKLKPALGAAGGGGPAATHAATSNGKLEEPGAQTITISGKVLDEALQYGATAGLPSLVKVSRDALHCSPSLPFMPGRTDGHGHLLKLVPGCDTVMDSTYALG